MAATLSNRPPTASITRHPSLKCRWSRHLPRPTSTAPHGRRPHRRTAPPKATRPEQAPQHKSHSTAASAGSFNPASMRSRAQPSRAVIAARPHRTLQIRAIKPRERRETGELDLFRSRLDQIIDMSHERVKFAKAISWTAIEAQCGEVYSDGPGMPPLPTWLSSSCRSFGRHLAASKACSSSGQ